MTEYGDRTPVGVLVYRAETPKSATVPMTKICWYIACKNFLILCFAGHYIPVCVVYMCGFVHVYFYLIIRTRFVILIVIVRNHASSIVYVNIFDNKMRICHNLYSKA